MEENSQIEESFAKYSTSSAHSTAYHPRRAASLTLRFQPHIPHHRFREAKQTFVERQLKIASDKERRTQALHELGKRKQVVIERYQERAEDLQAMRIARMQHKVVHTTMGLVPHKRHSPSICQARCSSA